MLATFTRVLAGFVLACLTVGVVQILFIMTPAQFWQLSAPAFQERAAQAGVLALLTATHAAIFSVAFTLIAAGVGESMRVRAPAYYIATGAIIAALGFNAQFASEVAGQPTIFNNYAIAAFATSGVLAGLVYWLVAGRYAGGANTDENLEDATARDVVPAVRTWKDRPRIVVEDPIIPGSAAGRRASLAGRLAERQDTRSDGNAPAHAAGAATKIPPLDAEGGKTQAAPAPKPARITADPPSPQKATANPAATVTPTKPAPAPNGAPQPANTAPPASSKTH